MKGDPLHISARQTIVHAICCLDKRIHAAIDPLDGVFVLDPGVAFVGLVLRIRAYVLEHEAIAGLLPVAGALDAVDFASDDGWLANGGRDK